MSTRPFAVPALAGSPDWLRLARRARLLSWLTLGWLGLEAGVGVAAAVIAGSAALLGFGLDSGIEALASIIVIWRFTGSRLAGQLSERRAQKLVAVSFWLLAPYIAAEGIQGYVLCCHILPKELLGLGHFSVPHLQLLRGQEVRHTLANLVPLAGDLFDDVGLCDAWVLLQIVAHLGASVCKGALQFFFLIVTEVKVGGKSSCFRDDLITLFWCKVHSNPPVVDRLLRGRPKAC